MNDFAGNWRMAAAMGMPHPDPNEHRWSARDYVAHTVRETGADPEQEVTQSPTASPITSVPAIGLAPENYGWQAKLRAFADRLGVHPLVVVGGGVAIIVGIGATIYVATRKEEGQ